MRYEVLGPFRVIDEHGTVVSLTSARQRAVLALLLVANGHPVSTDRLIDAVWGDQLPANPSNTLQQTMTQLRKIVEPARARSAKPSVLVSSDAGYQLNTEGNQLDTVDFEQLMSDAHELRAQNRLNEAMDAAESAAGLWRGPLAYADVAEVAAIAAEQRRWTDRRIEAVELAIGCRLVTEGPAAVVPQLEVLTTEYPHRDTLWSQLMTALSRAGRQVDALQAFRRASEASAELGLVVSTALSDLEQQILLQTEGTAATQDQQVASNLPVRYKRIIGRETELTELGRLLGRSRLVTVTGPGGSGKTELALELARRQRDAPNAALDAVWLIRLEDLRDPELLESSVAAVFGMPESGKQPIRQSLVEYLGESSVLFVLDNCEHLIDPVADFVAHLVVNAPNLTILTTSQVALNIGGEHRFPLTALDTPNEQSDIFARLDDAPAVQLFIERAKEVDADYSPAESELAAIVNIVTFLDGMPLAIELAAARARSLTAAEIARLLLEGPEVLITKRRDAPPRQRSLMSTIEWSYGLLSSEEQRAFVQLSVFAGSFDAEAAAAVMSTTEAAAQDMIDQLIASSIISRHAPLADVSRFGLLQTLRRFAASKLEANTEQAVSTRRRHAEFFAGRATQLDLELIGSKQKQAFVRLAADEDNYRRSMEWSLDQSAGAGGDLEPGLTVAAHLGRFWDWRGDLAEASTWLGRFDAAAREAHSDLSQLWMAMSWDAFFASELGQQRRAERSSATAASLARSQGDFANMVVTSGQGLRFRLDGRPADALARADQTAQTARQLGQDWWEAISYNLRALALLDLGDADAAATSAATAYEQFTAAGDQRAIGWVITAQAQIELHRGRSDEAARRAEAAAAASTEIGDGRNAAWAFEIGAAAATAAGDPDKAAALNAQAQIALSARGVAIAPWAKT